MNFPHDSGNISACLGYTNVSHEDMPSPCLFVVNRDIMRRHDYSTRTRALKATLLNKGTNSNLLASERGKAHEPQQPHVPEAPICYHRA